MRDANLIGFEEEEVCEQTFFELSNNKGEDEDDE